MRGGWSDDHDHDGDGDEGDDGGGDDNDEDDDDVDGLTVRESDDKGRLILHIENIFPTILPFFNLDIENYHNFYIVTTVTINTTTKKLFFFRFSWFGFRKRRSVDSQHGSNLGARFCSNSSSTLCKVHRW